MGTKTAPHASFHWLNCNQATTACHAATRRKHNARIARPKEILAVSAPSACGQLELDFEAFDTTTATSELDAFAALLANFSEKYERGPHESHSSAQLRVEPGRTSRTETEHRSQRSRLGQE